MADASTPFSISSSSSGRMMKFFEYAHLPEHLQRVSKPISELAHKFVDELPEGPEKTAGLRKLLEAKDCFVRTLL